MTVANQLFGGTFATNSGAFNVDDGGTTYDIATAVDYAIAGKAYHKATVSNGTTPTTDGDAAALSTLAASQGCLFVFTLDAAGTVDVWQSEVKTLASDEEFKDNGGVPQVPYVDLSLYCPFAYLMVKNGSTGSTWTFGSSNWDATGISYDEQDILTLPQRPPEP